MEKNTNKRVIVKTTTYGLLTEDEKKNVVMVVSNKSVFFNNKKSFLVGFHKHGKRSSNIFRKATFLREFKIRTVHVNQL